MLEPNYHFLVFVFLGKAIILVYEFLNNAENIKLNTSIQKVTNMIYSPAFNYGTINNNYGRNKKAVAFVLQRKISRGKLINEKT